MKLVARKYRKQIQIRLIKQKCRNLYGGAMRQNSGNKTDSRENKQTKNLCQKNMNCSMNTSMWSTEITIA